MPITATLSRKFYEKFGDEVTNELVTWLNAVDQSYREEFRELFAANFGQLRAEMTAFGAETHAEIETLRAELRSELRSEVGSLRSEIRAVEANLKLELVERVAQAERRLLVWMIGLWLSTPLATAGIVLLLRQLHWL